MNLHSAQFSENFVFETEVRDALEAGSPVVALESTIISHGMPFPKNVETALQVEALIRKEGVVPATIAVIDGKIRIGLNRSDLEILGGNQTKKQILKLSRRDLPYALTKKCSGSTTVAATLICAKMANIAVFVTGGVGGVHREAETTFDISADLQELARTRVAVISAGVKSILDMGLTLEVLETLGVPVLGFNTDIFPAFFSRESPFPLEHRLDDVSEIVTYLKYHWALEGTGGVLIANPIPKDRELPASIVEKHLIDGLKVAQRQEITGKNVTPFLLSYLVSQTGGRSLDANIALIENNAILGARLAAALGANHYF